MNPTHLALDLPARRVLAKALELEAEALGDEVRTARSGDELRAAAEKARIAAYLRDVVVDGVATVPSSDLPALRGLLASIRGERAQYVADEAACGRSETEAVVEGVVCERLLSLMECS